MDAERIVQELIAGTASLRMKVPTAMSLAIARAPIDADSAQVPMAGTARETSPHTTAKRAKVAKKIWVCLMPLLALALAVAVAAADLTGAWSLELDPDFSGNPDTVACGFSQNGHKLAIRCGGAEFAGEVNNEEVTWQFMTGPDRSTPATFRGVLGGEGKSISGTWHLATDPPRDGKFKARKESEV
jgi:hypothetical protein